MESGEKLPNKQTKKTTPKEEVVLTKDDFLKALKKATKPLPKASHGKGNRKRECLKV